MVMKVFTNENTRYDDETQAQVTAQVCDPDGVEWVMQLQTLLPHIEE
jgi:hypothetical protein